MSSVMNDRVLRAMTDDGAFRVMTIRATDTAQQVVTAQDVGGSAAVQLGELVASAVLVRETMAPPNRVQILLRDQGDDLMVGDSFPEGRTRGLARVADDQLGVSSQERGYLQVMRSLPGRAPHQGVVEVGCNGGIDSALVRYFEQSEQIATMVGVACVVDANEVMAVGGYVVQLLPELTASPLDAMRARLASFGELRPKLVDHDADPGWLLDAILANSEYTRLATSPVTFACGCGDDKAIGAVAALGEKELRELVESGETVSVTCDYCSERYELGRDDFRKILDGQG